MPVPPFTYAGPSVTAAFTTGMLNLSWDLALEKADEAKAATDNAIAQAGTADQIPESSLIYDVLLPDPIPGLPVYDPLAANTRYEAYKAELSDFLATKFAEFIGEFFPTSQYFVSAQAWLERQLASGGTGINFGVERQLWERDRSRVLAENLRSQAELRSSWAGKGYPLPPGALVTLSSMLDQDLLDKSADASRTAAIKAWETEVENTRLALTQSLQLRTQSLAAAFQYINATAQVAVQFSGSNSSAVADAETRMLNSITGLYGAEVQARELPLRVATTNAEVILKSREANLAAKVAAAHDRVTAAAAAAQALGGIAGAAVNALHSNVGIGGTEQL